jgi:hypothetical protein
MVNRAALPLTSALLSSPGCAALLFLILIGACASNAERGGPWCTPLVHSSGRLVLDGLAGSYDVVFGATAGNPGNPVAVGELYLFERDSSRRAIETPFGTIFPARLELYFGYATIDLKSVGGLTHGSLTSRDSSAPGVVLRVWMDTHPQPAQLEFGSDRTRRDLLILDGASTEANILETTPFGMRGAWESTIGTTTYRVTGFFCARRRP